LATGRLGDVFGHKKIFMLGWLWLSCSSFLAGLAHSWGPIAFNIARGLQGIGPALLVPNAMGLIGHTYPVGDKRAVVLSIFAACGPSGFLTGAMVSSIIAEFACKSPRA
jgi:MFS family permease